MSKSSETYPDASVTLKHLQKVLPHLQIPFWSHFGSFVKYCSVKLHRTADSKPYIETGSILCSFFVFLKNEQNRAVLHFWFVMNQQCRIARFSSFLKNMKNEHNIDPVSVYGLKSAVLWSLTEGYWQTTRNAIRKESEGTVGLFEIILELLRFWDGFRTVTPRVLETLSVKGLGKLIL